MNEKGVMAQPQYLKKRCPYCGEELSHLEQFTLKHKKVVVCKKCHKKIDERNVVY